MNVSTFKEWDIFGLKRSKIQKFHKICPLDYSQILCDGRHSKGRKSDFSNFLVQQDIQRTLFWCFRVQISDVSSRYFSC